jgi:hypothetical protein
MKITKENLKQIIKEEYDEVMKEDLGVDVNELATYLASIAKMGVQLSPLLLAFNPRIRKMVEPLLNKMVPNTKQDGGKDNE